MAGHAVEVMCHWLAATTDAWRPDAAYAVEPAPALRRRVARARAEE